MNFILSLLFPIRTIAALKPEQRKWAYVGLHVIAATMKSGRG